MFSIALGLVFITTVSIALVAFALAFLFRKHRFVKISLSVLGCSSIAVSLLIVCFVLTNGNSQPVKVDFSGVYHRISGIPGERGKLIVHPDSTFEVIDDLYLFRGGSCARFSPYLPELGARIYMNPDSGKHNGGSFHVTYDSFDTIYVFQLPDSYLAKDYALKNPHTYPLNSFSYEKVPSDNRIKRKN